MQLRYSYIRRANNDIQRNRESKIQAVIKHIEEEVPGVKFDRVNENSRTAIRIALDYKDPHGKMWSRVGREAENIDDDKPTMNLSEVTGHGSGEILEGTGEYIDIMHEFFHALGMYHEHQHPELNYTISETGMVTFDLYSIWSSWSSQLSERTWRKTGGLGRILRITWGN